jgi:hypothetical protein
MCVLEELCIRLIDRNKPVKRNCHLHSPNRKTFKLVITTRKYWLFLHALETSKNRPHRLKQIRRTPEHTS